MKIYKPLQRIFFNLLSVIIFFSCKKESYLTLEGKLLVSNTNPVEAGNYEIYFVQAGSPGIPIGIYNSHSSAYTTTDSKGNYSVNFRLGRSGFLIAQGSNSGPIDMVGEGSGNFPGFAIRSIPPIGGTFYLYKKIDNASLIISTLSTAISPADSIFIKYKSTSGPVEKKLTGISVPVNTNSFTLDNITNLALGYYDYEGKKYQNDVLIKLKRSGSTSAQPIHAAYNDSIPPGDEPTRQLGFFLY